MFIQYFFDASFNHVSYLIGCQQAKVAIVIDPGRNVDQYVSAAQRAGLRLAAVAETHIPADYVSGAHELAARHGAPLFVSGEESNRFRYAYLSYYSHQLLRDGDHFNVGQLHFDVVHTPGHSPESLCLLLTDRAVGATKPMGVFTGDLLTLGALNSPEILLEGATGIEFADSDAQQMFASLNAFRELPEYCQVWPAHLQVNLPSDIASLIATSTVGYEKRFNPAFQIATGDEFSRQVRQDRPEINPSLARIKMINQAGPEMLTTQAPQPHEAGMLRYAARVGNLIDLSQVDQFAHGHYPGSLNIPLDQLAKWVGWLLDYSQPTYLLGKPDELKRAIPILEKLGVETIGGVFFLHDAQRLGMLTESYTSLSPDQLATPIGTHKIRLLDVRPASYWQQGHIPYAKHVFLGSLQARIPEIPRDQPLVVQCQDGVLSGIAASLLQAAGCEVTNMLGGYDQWLASDLPIVRLDGTWASRPPRYACCSDVSAAV